MWRPRGLEAEKTGAGEQCSRKILMPPKHPKILPQVDMKYNCDLSMFNVLLFRQEFMELPLVAVPQGGKKAVVRRFNFPSGCQACFVSQRF